MRNLALLFFVFLFLPLLSVDEKTARQAEVEAEAGFYDSALLSFSSLDLQALRPWEQDILHYNRGVIQLKLGNYREAAKELQRIELHQNRSPYLDAHLYWNKTLSLLLLAEEEFRNNRPGGKDYLRQAKQSLEKAEEKRCELITLLGEKICPNFPLKKKVRRKNEQLLSQGYRVTLNRALMNYSLAETTLALKERLRFFQEQLSSLNEVKDNLSSIAIAYGQDAPLWQATLNKIDSEEERERFLPIAETYLQFITALDNNDLGKAKEGVSEAYDALKQFYSVLPKNERLIAELKEVERALQSALDRTKLDKRAYLSFRKEFGDVLKEAEEDLPGLEETRISLNQSWLEFHEGNAAYARLFIKNASFPVGEAITKLQAFEKMAYKKVLNEAVRQEKRSQALLPYYLDAASREGENDQAKELVAHYQAEAARTGDRFAQAVAAWQKETYQTTDQKELCLYQPWNEAIPLFQRGLLHAIEAKKALEPAEPLFKRTEQEQDESLKNWAAVQNLLRDYEPKPPPEEKRKESADTLTRSVIQMTLRDMPKKTVPRPAGGGKPW